MFIRRKRINDLENRVFLLEHWSRGVARQRDALTPENPYKIGLSVGTWHPSLSSLSEISFQIPSRVWYSAEVEAAWNQFEEVVERLQKEEHLRQRKALEDLPEYQACKQSSCRYPSVFDKGTNFAPDGR